MMNSTALKYFVAVASAGSFRRAAEALHVAASAVNRQVSLLEQSVRAPLFERRRGRNSLRLTPAGEILLRYARSAMKELERASAEIEALKGLRTGTVSFGAAETFARDFLPQFLADFHGQYPRISFRVTIGLSPHLCRLLEQDEIELALAFNPPPHHAIEVAHKIAMRPYVMVRKDHPLSRRRWVRLADCVDYPIVMPEIDTSIREGFDEMFARMRVQPSSIITTNSYEMLRSSASVGLGVAIVNKYLTDQGGPGEVAFIAIRDSTVRPQLLACCVRRGRRLSVGAMTFLELLKTRLNIKLIQT
jgi:DNA-binding transcriptional LysR family regulator